MSLVARVLNAWLKAVEKPAMARASGPDALRKRFELNARLFFHAPRGTQMLPQVLESGGRRVEVLQITPKSLKSSAVVLYIHGGGFVFGSPNAYAAMAGQLAKRLSARIVLPHYRRAPEAPFPAAFDDVRTAWEGLVASGVDPQDIVIGGDSAGGALSLSLLAALIAEQAELPAGVFCFSPLTDMTFSGESFKTNVKSEAVLPAAQADEMAQMYLNGHPAEDGRVSPLQASFVGAPPVWITVGNTEILLDDARRMATRLLDQRADATLIEEQDLPHVWPLFHNILPEARRTLDMLARWIRQQLRQPNEN